MSSEESGTSGGGGSGGGGGKASLSALVLSAMAMMGVVAMPGKQGASAPRSAPGSATAAAAAESSDSSGEDPQAFNGAKLVQQHWAAQDDDKLLPMLEVLDRFQAPRLARTPDQGKRLLSSAKRHVEYLLSGADGQDRMRFMVALVPDPVRSGSAYRYDQALTSMLLAFRRGGYVLDSHDLDHWHRTRTNADTAKAKKRTETGEMVYNSAEDDDLRAPGLILLRKLRPPDPNAEPSTTTGLTDSNDLIVLLLVAETPVRGVNTVMLHNCLDIAIRAWKLQPEKTGPPVRVVGPNFTGSGPSLVRSLSAWLAEFKQQNPDGLPDLESGSALISWVNGAAVAIDHGRMMEQFDTLVPGAVTFRATTDSSPELNRALLEYLITIKPLVGGDGLAYLTEETTGFGEASSKAFKAKGSVKSRRLSSKRLAAPPTASAESSPAADKTQNLKSLEKHFAIYRYTFPAHISEIRKRYQSQEQADQATVKLGDQDLKVKPSERLQFSNDGVDSPEFLASESPGMMAAYDELRLLRMVQDINRRGIRFAIFSATDVRDYLFLASFFREHCPNVQLATLSNDEALTHHEHISSLRGVIVASSYPLWLKDQDIDWSPMPGAQGAKLDGASLPDLRVQTLPMNASFALYNAALVHLIESEPDQDLADFLGSGFISASWPGSGGQDTVSPIWLSVVGYKGFEPLMLERPAQAQVQGEAGSPQGAELGRGVAGSFRDSAGRLAMGSLLHERARLKAEAKQPDASSTVAAFPLVGKDDADLAWSRYLRWASGTTPLLPLVLALIALVCFFVAYQRSHGVHHDLVHAWPLAEPGRRAREDVDLELERELSDRKNDLLGGALPWLRGVGSLLFGLGLLALLGGLWRGGQDWLVGVGDPRLEGYLQWTEENGIDAELEMISTEEILNMPMFNGEVELTGKIDMRVRRKGDGVRMFRDFKTVGGSFSDFYSTAHMNEQILTYMLLEQANNPEGERAEGGLFTLLKKVKRTANAKPPFYDQFEVRHNIFSLRSFWQRLHGTVTDLMNVKKALDAGTAHQAVAYPRPSRDCTWKCPFFSVCPLIDDGSAAENAIEELFEVSDPYAYYGVNEKKGND